MRITGLLSDLSHLCCVLVHLVSVDCLLLASSVQPMLATCPAGSLCTLDSPTPLSLVATLGLLQLSCSETFQSCSMASRINSKSLSLAFKALCDLVPACYLGLFCRAVAVVRSETILSSKRWQIPCRRTTHAWPCLDSCL